MTASRTLLLPVLAVLSLGLVACGSDDTSATDKACSARDDLSTSVQKVVTDLKAGNLGNAKDQLSDVKSKLSALGDAVGDLKSQEKDELQPQVQQVQDDLKALTDVSSLTELRTAFTTLDSSASALVKDLGTDLKCS
ncbi:hypothetical protein [Nocardioides sp. Iso805N]|uniref:hypothetical protein n=1 Tax=Nocardioides sp. Iso805N TaxID=1283287 RepID=UPI0003682174|nr:hypothetical protein [Nocardioides sp. Iso805N]